jgi:LysR family transcriptional regulator (chromosome initiation inhibitor)
MVPKVQAEARLRAGELVEFEPGHAIDVPLFWQQWKLDSPALAATARAVEEAAADAL